MGIKFSERMSAIAGMVTPGNRLADVGCDHAYIPIELCLEGKISSAVAMDVKPGPLMRAREHIAEYGLEERIKVRQSDGLKMLGEDEADTVLIAGMGGLLTVRILTEGKIPGSVTELVLAPQSEVPKVRRCLRELGFRISDEDMVPEEGKFYPVIKAVPGTDPEGDGPVRRMEDVCGPVLLRKRHPVLYKWLLRESEVTDGILVHLKTEILNAPDKEHLSSRIYELEGRKSLLSAALELYLREDYR